MQPALLAAHAGPASGDRHGCRLCGAFETEPRWSVDGYSIDRCAACGVLFVVDVPDSDTLSAHYGDIYRARSEPYGGGDPRDSAGRRNARGRVRMIRAAAGRGSLLDVGCGGGDFLIEARESFDVHGVEVNEQAAAHARSLGLPVSVAADLGDLVAAGRRYDVVTLWDVIEQLADPVGALCQVRALLAPDGLLFMTTGDAGSRAARASGRRWHLLTPPLHLFFFTRTSMAWMLDRAGFAPPAIRYPAQKVALGFAAFKLADRAPSPFTRTAQRLIDRLPLRRWALGVNLWDVMLVASRVSGSIEA